jgi:late competence protein required for DNA uptake (superfamily II DNA/RNA helicase)
VDLKHFKTFNDICPLCGYQIIWSCSGKSGFAYCSKNIKATRLKTDTMLCYWEGKAFRDSSGKIYFIHKL